MSPAVKVPGITEVSVPQVHVLDDVKNSDMTAPRNEYVFRTPFLISTLSPMLKDQRDEPMLCLALNIVQYVVPGVCVVYGSNLWAPMIPLLWRNLIGLAYVLGLVILFYERFILMLHFSSHRSIFLNEALNALFCWVFAPFFGIPCGVYRLHHCIMHHIENNHELDLSSTEKYQRDSWLSFLRYWLHFAVLIFVELPRYCVLSKRYSWLRSFLSGVLTYGTLLVLAAKFINPLATLWVFFIPHVTAMTIMAFGNWCQHIFVDPQQPDSNYALTYNCIDTPVNQRTFNDGYHIVHHVNARLHWSEMPNYFYEHKDKHIEGRALTFRGIHFFDVGVLVMTKQLRSLAKYYVHLGPRESAPTLDAVEEKLRSWLLPVPDTQASAKKAA